MAVFTRLSGYGLPLVIINIVNCTEYLSENNLIDSLVYSNRKITLPIHITISNIDLI